MKNSEFDNKIIEAFNSHSQIIDNDELWDNIEPHLKERKKNRFLIWIFLGLISGATAILYFNLGEKNINSVPSLQSENITETNDVASLSKSIDNTIADETDINQISKTSKDGEVAESQIKEDKTKESIAGDILENRDSEFNVLEQESKTTPVSLSKDYKILNDLTSEKSNTTSVPVPVNKNKIQKTNNQKNKTEFWNKLTDTEEVKSVDKNISKMSRLIPLRSINYALDLGTYNFNLRLPSIAKTRTLRPKRIKPRKRSDWHLHTQLTVSPILPIHVINTKNGGENNDLLQFRKDYVKQQFSFGADSKILLEHKKGLILIAGIQFQQINESIIRNISVDEQRRELLPATETENAEGNIVGSTLAYQDVTYTTNINQVFNNQYQFINIPVGIGFHLNKRRSNWRFFLGLEYNLFFKYRGDLAVNSEDVIELRYVQNIEDLVTIPRNAYQNFYEDNYGLGVWTSLEWQKPISERFSLTMAPGLQVPLKKITASAYVLQQNIVRLKLDLGINYQITKPDRKRKRRTIESPRW